MLAVSDCVPDGLPDNEGVPEPLRLELLLDDGDAVSLADIDCEGDKVSL